MFGDYRFEQVRLASFQNWPYKKTHDPYILANEGFHYLQHGDEVKCFYCHSKFSEWDSIDSLLYLHRNSSKHCAASVCKSNANIAIRADPLRNSIELGHDVVDSCLSK